MRRRFRLRRHLLPPLLTRLDSSCTRSPGLDGQAFDPAVRHRLADRARAHVVIRMLAYDVTWRSPGLGRGGLPSPQLTQGMPFLAMTAPPCGPVVGMTTDGFRGLGLLLGWMCGSVALVPSRICT